MSEGAEAVGTRPGGDAAPAWQPERTTPFTARCSPDGVYTRVSWFSQALLGYARQQLEGRKVLDFVHRDDAPAVQQAFDDAQSTRTHATVVFRHRRAGGGWTWLETVVFAVRDRDLHRVTRLFLSCRDVTAQVLVQEELRQTQAVLRLAFEHAPEGLAVTDLAGRFTMVNPVLAGVVGWSEAELLTKRLAEIVHPDDRAAHERCIGGVVRGDTATGDVDERLVTRSGGVAVVRLLVGVVRDDEGHPRQLVLQVSDVHRFKEREHDLERQAFLDPLTGVGNRRLLEERLSQALGDRRERAGQVGLILADIDDFKTVNDRFGHGAGDRLLVGVAHRIARSLRSQDTVARLGGDEFVVVCPGLREPDEAEVVLSRVRRAFDQPLSAGDGLEQVSTSIGMVLSQPGETVASLLQRADTEMYAAKGRKPGH